MWTRQFWGILVRGNMLNIFPVFWSLSFWAFCSSEFLPLPYIPFASLLPYFGLLYPPHMHSVHQLSAFQYAFTDHKL